VVERRAACERFGSRSLYASILATQRYAHPPTERLRDAVERVGPVRVDRPDRRIG